MKDSQYNSLLASHNFPPSVSVQLKVRFGHTNAKHSWNPLKPFQNWYVLRIWTWKLDRVKEINLKAWLGCSETHHAAGNSKAVRRTHGTFAHLPSQAALPTNTLEGRPTPQQLLLNLNFSCLLDRKGKYQRPPPPNHSQPFANVASLHMILIPTI